MKPHFPAAHPDLVADFDYARVSYRPLAEILQQPAKTSPVMEDHGTVEEGEGRGRSHSLSGDETVDGG